MSRTDPTTCTELVLVSGHAIFLGNSNSDLLSEDQWLMQPFQKQNPATNKPGEHETFVSHILTGAFAVAGRPKALLVFSGGRTTNADRTEAEGYEQVYRELGEPFDLEGRYALENHATDSYQNLLFSILRFRQVTGRYPEQVTVITHAFKQNRFLDLHATAIKWPAHRIRVLGLNPPFTSEELRETTEGELERAHKLFVQDPHGLRSPLADKRAARNFNPDEVVEWYRDLEPEVVELLKYSAGQWSSLPGRLPWEE